MKKRIIIIYTIIFILTIITSCSSPIKDYKEEVIAAEIEANLSKIDDELSNLATLYNDFYNSELEESYETKEAMLVALGYEELIDKIQEIKELIDNTSDKVNTLQVSDSEVIKVHQNLLKILDEYDVIIDTTSKNVAFLSNIMTEGGFFYQYYSELFILMISDEQPTLATALKLNSLLEEYNEDILFFSSDDVNYMTLIEDGKVDVKKLEDLNATYNEAKTKLEEITITSENDKKYLDLVSNLLESAIGITTTIVNNSQRIEEMHDEEAYEVYVQDKMLIIDDYRSKWQEGME